MALVTGTSATGSSDVYTYSSGSAPTVTGVSPSSGSTAGGNLVTVSGTNFAGVEEVDFGSTAADSFTVLSSTVLVATAPAGAAGSVHFTVKTDDGTSSTGAADLYTFV